MVWVFFLWVITIILFLINFFTPYPENKNFENRIILGGFSIGLVIGGILSAGMKNWFLVLIIIPLTIIFSILYIYIPKIFGTTK